MSDITKENQKTVALKLDPMEARSLRILAAEEDTTTPSLIREAIKFWWLTKHKAKRGDLTPAPVVEGPVPPEAPVDTEVPSA